MQTITLYVNAETTLGTVRDYANARNAAAPTLTRGVSACLKMRVFATAENADPYPIAELSNISAWQWIMDDDFDSTSNYILVADNDKIKVRSVTETINEMEYTFTEFTIPLSNMNTEELNTLLGKQEQVATLNGELVGYDESGNEVFVLQVKGFTVRNRISSTGNPTEIAAEYLNEAQVRALCSAGLDLIFAETASENSADWHAEQGATDKYFRVRLKGDNRVWETGNAADFGWGDCIGLLVGPQGEPGVDAKTYFPYIAFATAADGTDFITDGTEWTKEHKFIAFLSSEKTSVTEDDFAGLWVKFILDDAVDIKIADVGEFFTAEDVEGALQEIGNTLAGLEDLLKEI